jgi:hypothetical protein
LEDGRRQANDPALILSEGQVLIDCIVAEVKEPSVEFNRTIRGGGGSRLIAGTLRMFGILPEAAFEHGGLANRIANDLHTQITDERWPRIPQSVDAEHELSVRMVVFAPETAKHASERRHFDLQHVLDFTRDRTRSGQSCARYRDPAVPSASPWRGITRLIVQTLDASYEQGEAGLQLGEFIQRTVSKWDSQCA